MGAPIESWVKRAQVSAGAGPALFVGGALLAVAGWWFGGRAWPLAAVMAVLAVLLQFPRQHAWRVQSDALEFACLVAMPVALALLCVLWLHPAGRFSWAEVPVGLAGFFLALGVFHMTMRRHTLALADEIAAQANPETPHA